MGLHPVDCWLLLSERQLHLTPALVGFPSPLTHFPSPLPAFPGITVQKKKCLQQNPCSVPLGAAGLRQRQELHPTCGMFPTKGHMT